MTDVFMAMSGTDVAESMFVGAGDLRASVWYRRHDEYDRK
jgi:hypothetical protein